MLFCAFVATAWAGPTDLPEMSTDGSVKYYAIKSVRSNKYASYLDATGKLEQVAELSLNGLFYFTGEITETENLYSATQLATVKIGNFVAGSNKMAGFDSWNAEGANWYIWSNGSDGLHIVDKTNDKNQDGTQKDLWGGWNDGGNTITDYYHVDAGSYFVVEAKTLDDVKTIAKADLAKMAKLSALSTTENYNSAVSSVDAATTFAEVQVAVATYINTFNNKNVRFSNNGSDGRTGLNLSVNAGGGGLMGNAEEKDNSVWTLLSNGDGTFKLYNFSRNVYAKADRSCNADVAQAGNFTLKVTGDDKTALIAKNEMIHQASYWSPNYTILSWWDYNDNASIWTVEACDPTAITRADYDAALAAKATLPYAVQQAYGLVTNATNYYSNWKSDAEGSYEALLDNTTDTYFHSAYTDEAKAETADAHYIQATLAEGVDEFYFYMLPRSGNGNNRPQNITVSGSNDGETFTEIGQVTTTLDASMNPYVSEMLGTKGTTYKYIRLTVNSTNTGTKFFTLSELYFLPANADVTNLVNAYNSFASLSVTSSEMATAATVLINGEATLALANTKKEINALLTANATNHAETPALGQYSTAAYNALQAAYNATDATQESLETAIAAFKKAKNLPVFTIDGVISYAAGKSIYDDPGNVNGKGNTHYFKTTDVYDKTMWWALDMTETTVGVTEEVGIQNVGTGNGFWGVSSIKITETNENEGAGIADDGIFLFYTTGNDSPIHYQNDGQLICRYGDKGAASGSAHKFTYIGNTYDLAQLTDEKVTALAGLQTAYNAVAYLKDATLGSGLGQYTGSKDAIVAAVTAAEVIEAKTLAEQAVLDVATIAAATTALNECADDLTINLPVAGKYYRFQGACDVTPAEYANYYITGHTNEDGGRIALTAEADASTIYYFDGTNLIAYQSGLVIGLNSGHWVFASVDDDSKPASTITFAGSPRKAGTYTIKSADRYFHYFYYNVNNTVQVNRCQDDVCAEHDWNITEVTELPVEITAAGYATFYAPVEVTLPAEVTAHTVTENGEYATLSGAISVVPAKNGVILAGEAGTYNLTVSNTDAENLTNALAGTVAKTLVTKETGAYYVLGIVDEVVGLYKPVIDEDDTKFYNAGHKAYWHIPAASQTAGFRFGGNTTAIESVLIGADANAPIYDLSGRRVNNAVKGGIYIVNGKKVYVK